MVIAQTVVHITDMAKNYVNNKDLYEAMCKYHASVKKFEAGELNSKPIIPNYVGEAIMLICSRLAYKYNFINYTFKDEMVSDGIENCIMAINSFNPEKSNNPFAYFTQIAYNAFVRRILKEKKQTYIKHKNFEYMFCLDEMDSIFHDGHTVQQNVNEYSQDIISSFEEKKLIKSAQKKKKKIGLEIFEENDEK